MIIINICKTGSEGRGKEGGGKGRKNKGKRLSSSPNDLQPLLLDGLPMKIYHIIIII